MTKRTDGARPSPTPIDAFGAPLAVAGLAILSTIVALAVAYRLPRLQALEKEQPV